METAEKTTPPWRIAVAWTVVLIPLSWGVYQSVMKSLPLFESPPASKAPLSTGK